MERQPNWTRTYRSIGEAAIEAIARWIWLVSVRDDAYRDQCCVIVQRENDDGLGMPAFVIGRPGTEIGCLWR